MSNSIQQLRESFQTNGYCVIRRVVPPSLLAELRQTADIARDLARKLRGPDAQRLQPLSAHLDASAMKPLADLYDVQKLRDSVAGVLSKDFALTTERMGILFEPSKTPWTTHWHRDARDVNNAERLAAWEATQNNPGCWNQLNLPLYEDTCTWIVPGSHNRADTPGETAWLKSQTVADTRPAPVTDEEKEYRCMDNITVFPGGHRAVIDAGDMLLYRNTIWHLGNYTPYKKRATLHDNPMTPEYLALGGTALGIKPATAKA